MITKFNFWRCAESRLARNTAFWMTLLAGLCWLTSTSSAQSQTRSPFVLEDSFGEQVGELPSNLGSAENPFTPAPSVEAAPPLRPQYTPQLNPPQVNSNPRSFDGTIDGAFEASSFGNGAQGSDWRTPSADQRPQLVPSTPQLPRSRSFEGFQGRDLPYEGRCDGSSCQLPPVGYYRRPYSSDPGPYGDDYDWEYEREYRRAAAYHEARYRLEVAPVLLIPVPDYRPLYYRPPVVFPCWD